MQNLLLAFRHPQKRRLLLNSSFILTFALQFFLISLVPHPAAHAIDLCEKPIEETIEEMMAQSHLRRTRWGIDIQHLSATGQLRSLYAQNSQQFFLPASTAKLFTAIALAQTFEPGYRIETGYWGQGTPPHLTRLRIVGQGDPSILNSQLVQVAQTLKKQGIESIDTLMGEDTFFSYPQIIPSWEWEDLQTSDGVPINSLSFSQNSLPLRLSPRKVGQSLSLEWLDDKPLSPLIIENLTTTVSADQPEYVRLERNLAGTTLTIYGQLRAGASPDVSYVAIAYPPQYFLHRLRAALQSEGIQVKRLVVESSGDAVQDRPAIHEQKLGAISSPPLAEMLKTINQSSNNFYTESLLRHLAGKIALQQSVTPQFSLSTLKDLLASMAVEPSSYFLKDASGLSRQNLVSPESLTAALKAALKWRRAPGTSAKFQTWKDSLAIAGQTGTLKGRFKDSPVAGKLYAKTGTLNGTVTLAGFLVGPNQSTVILSLMANHSDQPISVLRQAIDDMVEKIAQTQSCQGDGL